MRMTLGQLRRIISEEVKILKENEDKESGFLSVIKKFFGGGKSTGGSSEKNGLKKINPNQVMRAISNSTLDQAQSMSREFSLTDDPKKRQKIVTDFVNVWAREIAERVDDEKRRGFSFEAKELDMLEPHWKAMWQSILKGKSPDLKPVVNIFLESLSKAEKTMGSLGPLGQKSKENDPGYRQGTRSQIRSDASGTPRHF